MYLKSSIHSGFSIFAFSIFFVVFSLLNASCLEAGSWGKTEEAIEFEGTTWNGAYVDVNGLYFTASIPNYSGVSLINNDISFRGHVSFLSGYFIFAPFNPDLPSQTEAEFVQMIQDFHPNYIVTSVDAKSLGAKYAVDLFPTKKEDSLFFRVLSTNNRLILLVTNDANDNRRSHFFNSIYIH